MLRKISFTLILCIGFTAAQAQSSLDKMVSELIVQLDTAQSPQTLMQLANTFERVALADEESWLARYYTAYAYVQLALLSEGEQIDVYCDQAVMFLESAEKISPQNSEIYALYSYLYGAKVNVDPMARGADLGRKSANYINLSIEADSTNPRPFLIRGMGKLQSPKGMGGGPERALPYLEKALENFNLFQAQEVNAPNWGKEMAERLLQECGKQ